MLIIRCFFFDTEPVFWQRQAFKSYLEVLQNYIFIAIYFKTKTTIAIE
jgi:hypothetical protein